MKIVGELMIQPAIMDAIRREEGNVSSVMRDLAQNLSNLRTEADFKRSGFLALCAITIGFGSLVTTVSLSVF